MDEDGDMEQITFNLSEAEPVVINFNNLSFSPPKKTRFWKKTLGDSAIIDVRIFDYAFFCPLPNNKEDERSL